MTRTTALVTNLALAAALLASAPVAAGPVTVTTIFLVDDTYGAVPYGTWLPGVVDELAMHLPGDTRWGMVSAPSYTTAGDPSKVTFGGAGDDFGTAEQLKAELLTFGLPYGGFGCDGWAAIDYALDEANYSFAGAGGDDRLLLVLVTDAARVSSDPTLTRADVENAVFGKEPTTYLNAIVNHGFNDGEPGPAGPGPALGMSWESGSFWRQEGPTAVEAPGGDLDPDRVPGMYADYVDLALLTGSAWDLLAAEAGGDEGAAFRQGFRDIKVRELGGAPSPEVPEPATAWLLAAGAGLLVLVRRMRRLVSR
jgi:hypothetical protein